MKKELLSPAGDIESLKAAIHGGCDAVYLAGKKFGARKFSKNFTNEELIDAIKYSHLYGVKIYVTVNTMIFEEEMEEALNYVGFLYKNGVDALIVQDIGLIREIKKIYPDLEIHASTQLHNYRQESFDLLEELGVTRVVLAREDTLEEINKIKTPLEKEVFIHGAICICYSGQCLFSSLVLNRSGNRGECAGMCRLPYKLKNNQEYIDTNGDYILSPRELCTIDNFKDLMDSDIKCFKIEGRMKSPAYVYYVTKIYRMLMDKYYQGLTLEITEEEYNNLLVLYNRKFTLGHLFDKKNSELMNIDSPNHQGLSLGKVISITPKKIGIKLSYGLNQEDGIRFTSENKGMIVNFLYNKNNMLINNAKPGEIVYVDNKIGLSKYSIVVKTIDKKLITLLENYPLKKIPITMKFTAILENNISLEVSDGKNKITLCKYMVDKALKTPTSKEDIISKLNKLGDTPYTLSKIDIEMSDNVFIPIKNINHLRQEIIEKLSLARTSTKSVNIKGKYIPKDVVKKKNNVKLSVLVRNKEQLLSVIDKDIDRIYLTDLNLFNEYSKSYKNLVYRENRLSPCNLNDRLMISEYASLGKNPSITDYYLNVANLSYIDYLSEKGIKNITLSVELNPSQIKEIASKNNTDSKLEILVYGRVELMVMKYSINDMFKLDKTNNYYLIDRNHQSYKLLEEEGFTHIFNSEKEHYTKEEVKKIIASNVDYIRLEFLDETKEEVLKILENYQQLIPKI